jgi:hypothetical protein
VTRTPKSDRESTSNVDTDQDRYPTLGRVLSLISEDIDFEGVRVQRVEITCLANGDATYRWWRPRAEEPEGGFFPADSSQ